MTFRRKRTAHRTTLKILAFLVLCLMMYSFRLLVGDQLFNNQVNNSTQCLNGFHAIWSLNISLNYNEQKVVWPEWYYQDVPSRFKNSPYDMRISTSDNDDFFNHPDSMIFDCDDIRGRGLELLVSILDTAKNTIVNAHVVHLLIEEGSIGCSTTQNVITRENSNPSSSSFAVLGVISTLISSERKNLDYDGTSEIRADDFLLKSVSSISEYENYYIERADGIDDNSWEGDSPFLLLDCDDLGQSRVIIWGVNDENDFAKIQSTVIVQPGQFSCSGSLPAVESSQQDTPRITELVTKEISLSLLPDPNTGLNSVRIKPEDVIIRAASRDNIPLQYAIEYKDPLTTPLTELDHVEFFIEDIGSVANKIWAFTENDPDPRGNGDFVEIQTRVIPTLLEVYEFDSFQVHPDFQCVEGCRSNDSLALVELYYSSNAPNWTKTWNLDKPMSTWFGITVNDDGCATYVDSSCRMQDSLVLVNLYHSTDGPNWKSTWDLCQPMSGWVGITLSDSGCVSKIDFYNNQLTGEIPKKLGQLSALTNLQLSFNQLTGKIPSELGQLKELTFLSLIGNQLTGAVPKELGQLTELSSLGLSENQLTGEIPKELGQLSELINLSLINNELTGEIPKELGQLAKLTILDFYNNELTGEIPKELGQLTELSSLGLSDNELTGEIPKELGQLTELTGLGLNGNQLTGEIPKELGQLTELSSLGLSDNQLTGEIPKELGQLTELTGLGLNGNQLTGEIPKELGQLIELTYMNLYDNQLTGEIPKELGNLTKIIRLDFGDNQLTGRIPKDLDQLSELVNLSLDKNQLTGEIPKELGNVASLNYLLIQNNNFAGIVPNELNSLHNLIKLRVCPGNHFIGPIPTFPNSPNLDVSSIDFSCITGARLQGSVYQTTACTDTTGRWPLDHIRIYYGQDSLLGTASGDFDFSMSEGTFDIQAYPVYDELYELACPDSGYYRIEINDLSDTIQGLDFGFRAVEECPLMQVSLEAPRQRWCAENSMELHYRNIGSLDADSAWIEVKFPAAITISETDHPYTVTPEGVWRFELGAVQRGSSGSIKLKNTVSCEVPFGTTLCVDVRIFPQYQCEKAYPVSSVSISVDATCEGDSIRFLLHNPGAEEVSTYYQLIRDFTIIDSVHFTLPGKASMDVIIAGTGHTYVMLVHDGDADPNNNPWSGVEQCGGAPAIQGILGQYPTQGNLHQNRLCRLLRGSYDPNDKLADPPGAGPEHRILPNLDIRYTVRFQNTGNDTAFAVVILDTIDTEVLDITSLRPGPSSHPYTFQVKEGNVLEFTFHPIALPDSTTDKDGSQGYVSYQIEQQKDLPTGTQIGNRAAIYFDNNPVVLTNTYFHQVHRPESMISTGIPEATEAGWLKIYPNPSSGQITIQAEFPVDQIQVYDVVGRLVGVFREPVLDIQNPGIYFLKIVNGGNQMTRRILIQK